MWIYAPRWFISVVANKNRTGHVLVRSRFPGHIEAAFPGVKVQYTPQADYQYRASVTRRRFEKLLADAALGVTYPNFKNAIPLGEEKYHSACSQVWATLRRASGATAYGSGGHLPLFENYHEDGGFAYHFESGQEEGCDGNCYLCRSWKDVPGCPMRQAEEGGL